MINVYDAEYPLVVLLPSPPPSLMSDYKANFKYVLSGEWLTDTRENVSRPDGYNATEKMISWARLGWSHVPIYAFVSLTVLAGGLLISGHDATHTHQIQNVHRIDYHHMLDGIFRWTQDYMPIILALFIPIVGWAAARFGRLTTIIVIVVLTLLLSPLSWASTNIAMFIVGYSLPDFLFAPSLILLGLIYCYESTPIKWRVPAVLCVSLFETVGGLFVALSDRIVPEMKEGQPRRDWHWIVIQIGALIPALVVLVVGVTMARDTPISLVNRGAASAAYDQLETNGKKLLTGPVPLSRPEFVDVAERETLAAMSILQNLKRSSGPLLVVVATSIVWAICDKSVLGTYYYIAEDYMGGVVHEENPDILPMRLLKHCVAMAGIALTLVGWMRIEDIRFGPALATLIAAVGSLMCSTIKVTDDWGHELEIAEVSSIETVTLGVVSISFALPMVQATMRIMAMDLFSNKSRSQGMFIVLAVEIACGGLMSQLQYRARGKDWVYITLAGVVAILAGLVFAAFYLTHWFDHSILCRDPETDACWLIKEQSYEEAAVTSPLLFHSGVIIVDDDDDDNGGGRK